MNKFAASVLLWVAGSAASTARASVAGPDWVAGAYFVTGQPGAFGGEASMAALFQPLPEHEALMGPKASVLYAFGSGDVTRVDLNLGVAGVVWLANAVGSGLDVDLVAPSTLSGTAAAVHFRVEPNLSVRIAHFADGGAWAVRVGVPYDTGYQWGFQAGVSLQFNGVPETGGSDKSL